MVKINDKSKIIPINKLGMPKPPPPKPEYYPINWDKIHNFGQLITVLRNIPMKISAHHRDFEKLKPFLIIPSKDAKGKKTV